MAPASLPRRRVLALAGSALLGGCLSSSQPVGSSQSSPTAKPASDGSWAQAGRDANHSGYNPAIPASISTKRWSVEVEGPLTTPTVVNDRVYVTRGEPTNAGTDATLEAYALDSGERQWTTSLDTTFTFHAPLSDLRPVYHDGVLYLNVDERFVALDAATRETRWETERFSGFINDPPVVTEDAVYGAGRGGLICFDHGGSEQWRFTPGDGMHSPSHPAVLDDTLYTTTANHLIAFDAATGEERWRAQSTSHRGSVVATENAVIAGRREIDVYEPDGTERWQAAGAKKGGIRPATDGENVYLADLRGNVLARDLDSGEAVWRRELPESEWAQGTIPTVTDGAVNVVRTDGENVTVYALDAEGGKTRWKRSKSGNRGRGPIPANGTIAFTSEYTPPDQRQSKTISGGLDTTSHLWAFAV
jgi:outer membrane protein assembly factor BamB